MKRRDLEDLKRQQSQKPRRSKFVWLGIGAIALLSGVFFIGKEIARIQSRSIVVSDCTKIQEAIQYNNLDTLIEEFRSGAISYGYTFEILRKGMTGSDEFVREVLAEKQKRAITIQRAIEIADLMDREVSKYAQVSLKDNGVKSNYSIMLNGWKIHADKIREWAKSPNRIGMYSSREWMGFEFYSASWKLEYLCLQEE
jgi:hypothetical protein